MDYSFLDKPEYSDIPIYNVTKDQRENPQVHITKYVPRIDKKLTDIEDCKSITYTRESHPYY